MVDVAPYRNLYRIRPPATGPAYAAAVDALDDVEGIGPTRKRALLRRFGSVRGVREASAEEIAGVGGIGSGLADRIKQALS